jgi:hypothetical protein
MVLIFDGIIQILMLRLGYEFKTTAVILGLIGDTIEV